MALSERVTNDYDNWTEAGDLAWVLLDGNATARNTSSTSTVITYTSTISKTFDLSRNAVEATLNVVGRRRVSPLGENGSSRTIIKLKDVDDVWHVLYDQEGNQGGSTTYLSSLDIASLLTQAGTYTLQFTAVVKSGTQNGSFRPSWAQFESVSLMADTVTTHVKLLTETLDITEVLIIGSTFLETLGLVEHFDAVKTTPAVSKEERLLAGKTDNEIYIFEAADPTGEYCTDDEDFGHPGMVKTLSEVQFESSATSPHSVEVRVSIDSGLTWTSIGVVIAQRGVVCSVAPWITAEKHRVCFQGPGLRLSSYTLYAIPRGKMLRET